MDQFNVFFEQHLFYALAKEKELPINVLFSEIINDNGYKHLGDFHEVPFNRTYLHLLGHFKKDEFTCIRMAAKLRELYPEYYYKILSLFEANTTFVNVQEPNIINNFEFLHKTAIKAYKEQKTDIAIKKETIKGSKNKQLDLLRTIAENTVINQLQDEFQQDYLLFYNALCTVIDKKASEIYLYGRDLHATYWYRDIFAYESKLLDKNLVKCLEIEIIESNFNWSGIFNKHYRYGVEYYTKLKIEQGKYFNLIVPETSDYEFSLYDIDQLDYEILNHLTEPTSVEDLLLKMQTCFEDEIIQNHYDMFYNLIVLSLKHLVEKKIVKPA